MNNGIINLMYYRCYICHATQDVSAEAICHVTRNVYAEINNFFLVRASCGVVEISFYHIHLII